MYSIFRLSIFASCRRNKYFAIVLFVLLVAQAAPATAGATLSIQDRVGFERAIEQVYWNNRTWPDSRSPKPSLHQVMSDAVIRARVDDYLRKSDALEFFWERPITGEELQAEIDRMISNTKQPAMLQQLFAALGNDPYVIAECLARPVLANRLIYRLYDTDERIHGSLRAQAQSELQFTNTVESLRALSGHYREITLLQKGKGAMSRALELDREEWKEWMQQLGDLFPGQKLIVGRITALQEDTDRIFVTAVVDKTPYSVRIATVEWQKQAFEDWWGLAQLQTRNEIKTPVRAYTLTPAVGTCADDTWSRMRISSPLKRYLHAAIWTGSEMIIWGGLAAGGITNTGGKYNPATDTWAEGGTSLTNAPTARQYFTAVWTGAEMIIWGGADGPNIEVNTGGRYNPATNTWVATSTSSAPMERVGHTAVWTGSEMLIWGGMKDFVSLNNGGRYNPANNTWAAGGINTTNAPSARSFHTAVWSGTHMIIWGGSSVTTTGGRYNPATNTWTTTTTTNAPDDRTGHTAIWTGSEMIVWGGNAAGMGSSQSGGRYNPATNTWVATSLANAPSQRTDHTAVWTGTEMIIWGGMQLNSGGRYNPSSDTWVSGGTSIWNAPVARTRQSAVWTGSEMIVWGGNIADIGITSTGGRYNPASNTWAAGGTHVDFAPVGRTSHSAVWTGAEMVVWGGFTPHGYTNTGGRYYPATDSWAAEGTASTGAPTARIGHTAIWTGTEMLIWGGTDENGRSNSGGRFSPAANSWAGGDISTTNAPVARDSHTAIWTGATMLIWGGFDGTSLLQTGGRYNPASNTWIAGGITLTNAPSARDLHTAIWTGIEMIVWGGGNSTSTGGRYNPSSNTWAVGGTSLTGMPNGRYLHTAVWTGTEMIVWGGYNGSERLNTGGRYNPATNTWFAGGTSLTNAPEVRNLHQAVWTGNEMIVWGGFNGSIRLVSGGRYNPLADTWKTGGTSTSNAPSARFGHTAVWDGEKMIVWGGHDGIRVDTGGSYCAVPAPDCLFCDDFEDGIASANWTIIKPTWNETGGNLIGSSARKAAIVASPAFEGCSLCSVEATMRTGGGIGNRVWLLVWYADKNNYIELMMNEEKDKWLLKQRSGGSVVTKAKGIKSILPNTSYVAKITYEGKQFNVSIDGTLLFTMTAIGSVPPGTVGFQSKGTTSTFGYITVQDAGL